MSIVKFCVLFVFVVQMTAILSPVVATNGKDEAVLAISSAEEVMASAYQAVKEAENAGADVSGFSELLKDGVQLLALANTSFRIGDFDSAVQFANLSSEIGKEVEVKAYRLRDFQRGLPLWHMWLTMVQSFLAVLVVVLASFWSWRFFKRLYYRRIRVMKPEVARDES